MMVGIHRLASHTSNVKPFGNIQRHQSRYPLTVRWALPDLNSTVARVYRLVPIRVMRRQILLRQPTTLLLHIRRDLLPDISLVVSLATAFSYHLQRSTQFRQCGHLSAFGRTPTNRQHLNTRWPMPQLLLASLPTVSDHL